MSSRVLNKLEAAAARWTVRKKLKTQYQKMVTSPYRGVKGDYIFDPAVQRHYSMQYTYPEFVRMKPKNFFLYMSLLFGLPTFASYVTNWEHESRMEKMRDGTVPYYARHAT
ncbi:hypothetical protein SNEBB_000830 [Seison nebaliae]|nr:hypothetical protein SNEBB_000830 [Seison nebaliae]